jgi:glyoxylase-like metal-dependent hydrolase (beta-lactamase superfamily II)
MGDVVVRRIEEVLEPGFTPAFLFPGFDPAMLDAHPQATLPGFYDAGNGRAWSSIHSWLISIGGRNVLVDTCVGNGKTRALPLLQRFHMRDLPWLDNLARAGFGPEDIDVVFCTHLHVDHVGWNTRAEGGTWVPTFPKARHVFGRAEYAHWTSGRGPALFPENAAVIEDSVRPVVAAGLVELVDPGDEIVPGLRVEAAPGHTAHQLTLHHDGPGGGFVIAADALHHPLQVYEPQLGTRFCEDSATAEATRRRLLARCADSGALLLSMHFGAPHAGRIRREGAGFGFTPEAA